MSLYLLRKINNDYSIAKFEDSSDPIDVYTINSRGCSCPSRYRNCKHAKLLKIWQNNGCIPGQVYDNDGHLINTLAVELVDL